MVWFFFPRAGWLQKDYGLSPLSRFWHFPSFVVATATHCSFVFVSHYLFAGLQDQVMTPNCCALSRNFLSEGLERYLALLVACLSALLLPCAMSICRFEFFYSAAAASQRLSAHPMVIVMGSRPLMLRHNQSKQKPSHGLFFLRDTNCLFLFVLSASKAR